MPKLKTEPTLSGTQATLQPIPPDPAVPSFPFPGLVLSTTDWTSYPSSCFLLLLPVRVPGSGSWLRFRLQVQAALAHLPLAAAAVASRPKSFIPSYFVSFVLRTQFIQSTTPHLLLHHHHSSSLLQSISSSLHPSAASSFGSCRKKDPD